MTTQEEQRDKQLNAIGWEMDDLSAEGKLDFDHFKSLFHRALAVCGPDTDSLEMFCHSARGEGWWDWMMQELQKAQSKRVA